jgi:hypothetical protein
MKAPQTENSGLNSIICNRQSKTERSCHRPFKSKRISPSSPEKSAYHEWSTAEIYWTPTKNWQPIRQLISSRF